MASLIFKGAVTCQIVISRRLIPIREAPGQRAPGGIAFRFSVESPLREGPGYVLADDDGSQRAVSVRGITFDDSGGHGLAYYLDVSGT